VRRAATGDETVALIRGEGGEALSIETDVARREQVDRAVALAVERYGGLDIMIHNASSGLSGHPAQLQDITAQAWDEQLAVGMNGSLHCAQAAFPHLKRSGHGRYIGLNSAFGLHGAGMNPVYAAGKGALRGFIKALAREWGPHGITVNAIAPASATDASDAFFEQNPPLKEAFLRNFPMRRMGQPRQDIGGAVVAMCSDGFGYVSGQTLFVDGGLMTVL
jgi:3-oxoacyl-[acyl-carrier protein] reductase